MHTILLFRLGYNNVVETVIRKEEGNSLREIKEVLCIYYNELPLLFLLSSSIMHHEYTIYRLADVEVVLMRPNE